MTIRKNEMKNNQYSWSCPWSVATETQHAQGPPGRDRGRPTGTVDLNFKLDLEGFFFNMEAAGNYGHEVPLPLLLPAAVPVLSLPALR